MEGISTHHARILEAAFAVTEGGGESGAAGLVIAGRLPIIGGGIDGDCPHAGCVAVTVTVVIRPAVTRRPHVDRALLIATLHQATKNDNLLRFPSLDILKP